MNATQWAIKWGVPFEALAELTSDVLGLEGNDPMPPKSGNSEDAVQAVVMLEAPHKGVKLWRNNVGVLQDDRGVPVRYGLANQSPAQNKILKSGDLIGIRKVFITPAMVGWTIGQFVSREVKKVGWRYTGDAHETAQLNWANLINSYGGDAAFVTGEGTL